MLRLTVGAGAFGRRVRWIKAPAGAMFPHQRKLNRQAARVRSASRRQRLSIKQDRASDVCREET
jgi:hypothetical protein